MGSTTGSNTKMDYTRQSGILHQPCETCQSTKLKVVTSMCTQANFQPFTDGQGNRHFHDGNHGWVTVRCDNGHVTDQTFVWQCPCGWTTKQQWADQAASNAKYRRAQRAWGKFFEG